jgi:putative endonuclease
VHCVYIVRCADGTLYTGYARDPDAREKVHNSGRGARYTSGRRPVVLVYRETFESRGDALRREHELKQWSRRRKEVLIATVVVRQKPPARRRKRMSTAGTISR